MATLSYTDRWDTDFTCIGSRTRGDRCRANILDAQRSVAGAVLNMVWLWEPTDDDTRMALGAIAEQCLCDQHRNQLAVITRDWQRELALMVAEHAPSAEIRLAREVRRLLTEGLPQATGRSPYQLVRWCIDSPPGDLLARINRIKMMDEYFADAQASSGSSTSRATNFRGYGGMSNPEASDVRGLQGLPGFSDAANLRQGYYDAPLRRYLPRASAIQHDGPLGLTGDERMSRLGLQDVLRSGSQASQYGPVPVHYGGGLVSAIATLDRPATPFPLREHYGQSRFRPEPTPQTPAWRSEPAMARSSVSARPSLDRTSERFQQTSRGSNTTNDVESLIDSMRRLNGDYNRRFGSAISQLAASTSSGVNSCRHKATRRKLEGDCPICLEPLMMGEGLIWCKEGCGQNLHRECWTEYANSQARPKCVVCRSRWSTRSCLCDEGLP